MTHRALQGIDALVSLLVANGRWSDRVYKMRPRPLAEDELESVFVMPGEDIPNAPAGSWNMAVIDSQQVVKVTAVRTGGQDDELLSALYDDRAAIHVALMADITAGLSFVTEVRYLGAGEPVLDGEASRLVGVYETRWALLYRMNFTDPN